jgi:hypothetical protein
MEGMVALMLPVVLMPMFLLFLNWLTAALEECRYRVSDTVSVWYL